MTVLGILLSAGAAHASATLFLEEPYGRLGFFTATGHAAVYLSGVCAQTPLVLRKCAPEELGAVISRYDGVGGYDWVAIPLIPYLYAVERTEDIPLFVNPKIVSFLRDQYRRNHLEAVAPDADNGDAPGGNWYELVGSAFDRAAYAFEIETSETQDAAFIDSYNQRQNRSHFHTVSSNCADFAKDVINFYYPKALHRSVVADVGITTPKQMAKTLVKFSERHPELAFSHYVIPQVPGQEARSSAVHGVVESFLKSKKYMVPSAVVSPIFAGCVVTVYEGTGAGRFNPARRALVYSADRALEEPIGSEDRRSYELELSHLTAADTTKISGTRVEKSFARMLNAGVPGFDAEGRPILRMRVAHDEVNLGLVRNNLFTTESDGRFTQQLLEARLEEELRHGSSPKVSESDLEKDWTLLQKAVSVSDNQIATRDASSQSRWSRAGNRP